MNLDANSNPAHLGGPQEVDLRSGNKSHVSLACAMVFPVWWVGLLVPKCSLALSSAQQILSQEWLCHLLGSLVRHVVLLSAHTWGPNSKLTSQAYDCAPGTKKKKKTTCMQRFYKFGHCDQTLLPILWNCDKSLGIKQHGDHRGYYVYCAEQTVINH